MRRIRRLFPALALVLAACLAAGWWLLVPSDYQALGRHAAASAAFVANLAFWLEADYFAPAADTLPLLHLWSLGVEEQFYLAWPLLLLLGLRLAGGMRLHVLVLGGLSLIACLVLTPRDPARLLLRHPFGSCWGCVAGNARIGHAGGSARCSACGFAPSGRTAHRHAAFRSQRNARACGTRGVLRPASHRRPLFSPGAH